MICVSLKQAGRPRRAGIITCDLLQGPFRGSVVLPGSQGFNLGGKTPVFMTA